MSWTKRQLIDKAFNESAFSDYVFNLTPGQQQTAADALDGMMGQWEMDGIYLGYPIPENPDDYDLDIDTKLDVNVNRAVYMNLSITIDASFGKTPFPATVKAADMGLNSLYARASVPPTKQYPSTMPVGAGNNDLINTFFGEPVDDTQDDIDAAETNTGRRRSRNG